MGEHGIKPIEQVDPLARLSMACPALPLCGLAQTEAERIMPSYIERMRSVMEKVGVDDEEILMRMTGCPNGCARPFKAKMKNDAMEATMEPILAMFKAQRQEFEAFGD